MKWVSYYLKGTGGWHGEPETSALVRIYVDDDTPSHVCAELAAKEAEEQGCLPSGHRIVREVVEQRDMFYNRLFTSEDAQAILNNSELCALIR